MFSWTKYLTPDCIGTAFPFLSNAVRVRNQFKENPKTSKRTKGATKSKENKNDVEDGDENEAKGPEKNLEGRPICSLHEKSHFSRRLTSPKEIRMRSPVPLER